MALSTFKPSRSEVPLFALFCAAIGVLAATAAAWIQDGGSGAWGHWEWAAAAAKAALWAALAALITNTYVRRMCMRRLEAKLARMRMLTELLDHVDEIEKLAVVHELQNTFTETVEYYRSIDNGEDEDEEIKSGIETIGRRIRVMYDELSGQIRHTRCNADEFSRAMEILGRGIDGRLKKRRR